MYKIIKKQIGFTLMETVIATAVFIVAVVVLTDIFVISQRAQGKFENQTRVELDARYALDVLTAEIRKSKINYDYIFAHGGFPGGLNDYLDYLPLINDFGDTVVFSKKTSGDGVCDHGVSSCLAIKRRDSDFASITPRGVELKSVRFYIDPQEDPFKISTSTWQYPFGNKLIGDMHTIQPRVTIVFITKSSTASHGAEDFTSYLQTTAVTRTYDRYESKK